MAGLSNAIREFRTGGLSHNEFLAKIDRVLAADQTDHARLLEILSEEHTKLPLPPDVYEEVHRRIEHLAEPDAPRRDDQTRMLMSADDAFAGGTAVPPGSSGGETDGIKGVGDTINGRFLLEECLGFGGMGTVYKAVDLRKLEASDRNPYIAIKVLNVQFRGHPKSLIALQREAKKAQTLAHPNIVTVYDFDRDGTMVYLTMEYLCGKPLSRVLRAPNFRGMPYEKALPIVTGMANALSYAHERGFVHCDFKPANVFLTDSGQVKVIDFGIARVFRKSEEEAEATVFDPGTLGGLTPAYASPEMLEHREPDPRDDIYALACIAYELLTGSHPFGRLPATQARATGLRPQRPKGLGAKPWRALRAGLSFDRESRPRSVAQFCTGFSGESRASLPIAAGLAAAAALVVGIAAVGYFGFPSRGPAPPPTAAVTESEAPTTEAVEPPPAETPPPLSLAAVSAVLDGIPCSALAASVGGDTVKVQGYVPQSFGAERLRNALAAIPGTETVAAELQTVADDQCDVVERFAPYWKRNRVAGGATSIGMLGADTELVEGDSLIFEVTTPDYESYVYVDYYVLDGSVAHLVPSRRITANRAPPDYTAKIGTLSGWTISKPFGSELIVLLVTPVPLFDQPRPDVERKTDYLAAIDQRLKWMADEHGAERITAEFVQITTQARAR